jgi:group I intron endonuclease
MNIGIYKWTSPTGKIYVGQSKNLKQRKEWYLSGGVEKSSMVKLKRSFNKYGIKSHIFEVIEYCSIDQLNEKEIYWGKYYNTLNQGLNCKLGEQNCIFSDHTKIRMSNAKKGKPLPEIHQKNKIKSLKKYWESTKNKPLKENKIKYIPTDEHKLNISKANKGKPKHTHESKQKLKEYGKNRDLTKMRNASVKSTSKQVFQYDLNGEFIKQWSSLSEAERFYNGKVGDNIGDTIRHFKKTGIQRKSYGFIWKSE